jgi:AcrR family transcriptional regulator
MRVKTEERRQAILAAAAEEFQATGFHRTSMASIAARAACSKVTLYGYFETKDQLFFEAVVAATAHQFADLYLLLESTEPARDVLATFGERFIALICDDQVKALRRLVMTAAAEGETALAQRCYDEGPKVALQVCAAYFTKVHERGELQIAAPGLAGNQLRALLEAEWLDSLLYGEQVKPSKRRIRESAQRAVDAFFAIYGTG